MAKSKSRRTNVPNETREYSPRKTASKREAEIAAERARADAAQERENLFDARFARVFPFLAAALLLCGALLIFSRLGYAPYSHDEGIHGIYGFDLDAYKYDPIYHAPLLYHLVALSFHFLGDSDATGRLVPALMGFGVVALTLFSGRKNAHLRQRDATPQNENEEESAAASTRTAALVQWSKRAAWCAIFLIIIALIFLRSGKGEFVFPLALVIAALSIFVWKYGAHRERVNAAASTREDSPNAFADNAFASNAFATWDARAAFCAAALLICSPVFVAYSRHLIHDSLVMFLTLGAVLCFQSARGDGAQTARGTFSRLGVAAFLALLVCTKANAFFIIAMLFGAWCAAKLSPRVLALFLPVKSRAWPWFVPLGAFVVVGVASVFAVRAAPGEAETFAAQGKWLAVICVAATLVLWEWMRRDGTSGEYSPGKTTREENASVPRTSFFASLRVLAMCALAAIFIYAFFYGHGYLWLEKWRAGENLRQLYGGDLWGPQSAMPRMIEYWSGQQKKPRLAGRHDYYLVLMAIYELPIVLAALGGIVRAAKQRTPFTDLLIWWSFTSFAIYSLANEKVPWLMVHIILPLALLGGWFLAQKWRDIALRDIASPEDSEVASTRSFAPRFYVPALACVAGAIFLLRGVFATSFGRPVDNKEPLYYAQASESYRDAFIGGMRETLPREGGLWVHPDAAWPTVWYVRKGAPDLGKSAVDWSAIISIPNPRLALTHTEKWWKEQYEANKISWPQYASVQYRTKGWKRQTVKFDNWPRASWGALRPDRYVNFWLHRVADFHYDAQTQTSTGFLSEWSYVEFDVLTPPAGAAP